MCVNKRTGRNGQFKLCLRGNIAFGVRNNAIAQILASSAARDGVYQVMTNLADEVNITEYANPHAYRHAWSIEALRNGADIPTVARVLGNEPQTVMKSYSRWATNDIQERHQQFSWKTNGNGNGRNGHH